jgi:hypothetical protein
LKTKRLQKNLINMWLDQIVKDAVKRQKEANAKRKYKIVDKKGKKVWDINFKSIKEAEECLVRAIKAANVQNAIFYYRNYSIKPIGKL